VSAPKTALLPIKTTPDAESGPESPSQPASVPGDAKSPVEEWYAKYDKFVWSKIHKALEPRFDAEGNPDEANLVRGRKLDLAEELHVVSGRISLRNGRGIKTGALSTAQWPGSVLLP
jgi:hypothetical protein